jgi:hypothetical protein
MRGTMSVELPAAKGTTARSGFSGQACASAELTATKDPTTATNIDPIVRIAFLPVTGEPWSAEADIASNT